MKFFEKMRPEVFLQSAKYRRDKKTQKRIWGFTLIVTFTAQLAKSCDVPIRKLYDYITDRDKAPETITIEQVKNEENAEIRRVMIERMGWEDFCAKAKVRVIHVDELHASFPAIPVSELVEDGARLVTSYRDGSERATLLEAEGLTDFEDRPLRFVRLKDPSTGREYTLRVRHDHSRCYEAVGWTFGLTETEYKRGKFIRQGDVFLKPIAGGPLEQRHS